MTTPAMTEAEENFAYWVESYATDLANGRDPTEFGMKWMAYQIKIWGDTVETERNSQKKE
jgi:hypothetical protein